MIVGIRLRDASAFVPVRKKLQQTQTQARAEDKI